MKLRDGITVYSGAKSFKGEVPDGLVDKKVIDRLNKQQEKKAANDKKSDADSVDPDEVFDGEKKSASDSDKD